MGARNRTLNAPNLSILNSQERTAFDARWDFLQRYVEDVHAPKTPGSLRSGYSAAEFTALSRPDRSAVLRAAAVADVLAGRVLLKTSTVEHGSEPVPATSRSTARANDQTIGTSAAEPDRLSRSRYFVPCAECGTLLPARGPKAVAAYCRDDAKRKAARERRRIEEGRKAA